jgi:hypothetical protein
VKWRTILEQAVTWYCTMFTVFVLHTYFRGFELDVSWLAILSTAPVVVLLLKTLIGSLQFKSAEEVENG